MKKLFLVVAVLGLTACSAPTVDDLVSDPKLLAKIIEGCEEMERLGKSTDTDECRNAVNASKKIILNNADAAFKNIKKHGEVVLNDAKKRSAKTVQELEQGAKEALDSAKENSAELIEKAKKLLEE